MLTIPYTLIYWNTLKKEKKTKIFMRQNTVIVGYGQIGKSLYSLLRKKYTVHSVDVKNNKFLIKNVKVLHICFPYSNNFVSEVNKYKKIYNPIYTVIHSTIPVGTSEKCKAYYSPVRGIHPYLKKSLKIFVKYMAPKNKFLKNYFSKVGVKVEEHASRKTLEAMKLYCTTMYGLNIIAEKEIWNFCKKHKLDYDIVYTKSNKTYNDGYKKLGFPQFIRYDLKHMDGKIGGHCVIPNCYLLNSNISKFIINQNKKL